MRKYLMLSMCFLFACNVVVRADEKATTKMAVEELRKQEKTAFNGLMNEYFEASHRPAKPLVAGDRKKLLDKLMVDWQKLADSGNYIATCELADHWQRESARRNSDSTDLTQRAIELYQKGYKLARTDEEREKVKGDLTALRWIAALTVLSRIRDDEDSQK